MVQVFAGELKLCNKDNIIIGSELFLRCIISQISLRGSPVCNRGFTCGNFVSGRFTACPGTDLALIFWLQFSHRENDRDRMYRDTLTGVYKYEFGPVLKVSQNHQILSTRNFLRVFQSFHKSLHAHLYPCEHFESRLFESFLMFRLPKIPISTSKETSEDKVKVCCGFSFL